MLVRTFAAWLLLPLVVAFFPEKPMDNIVFRRPAVSSSSGRAPLLRMRGGKQAQPAIPKIKLTYFDIEGAAEKVRLAMKIGGIDFEDERIEFSKWPELKPKTPFGQLPILSIDGSEPVAQSFAMLRYVGRICDLYPSDPEAALKIDEVCGLQEDLAKALTPSYQIGVRPHLLGYPADLPENERKTIQSKLRQALMAPDGDVPRFLRYFERILEKAGGMFLCGEFVTIADCALLPQLRQFANGRLDGIPTNCLDAYPRLTAWYTRMMQLPPVQKHYA